MSVNTNAWPEGSRSDSIEWWAIDTARRRIYKMPGQDIFATGYFPHRREGGTARSEEHTSELQSLMRNSYAVFCLKKKTNTTNKLTTQVISINRQFVT